MPRVTHVKKARKDNPVCKKGEPYYWWKFRYGGKHYSLTYPRPSQLTQSEFLSQIYDLGEEIEGWTPSGDDDDWKEEAAAAISDWADQARSIGEEQEERLCNMPDQLQEGDTGILLQDRGQYCQEMADDLENLDLDLFESADDFTSALTDIQYQGE
jgi:hypothetical protein